ncbi:MAG: hypothetical protein LBG58_03185 [Planctomycetaceae bacterium]|jgi:hypothetical protein|nr:hypothetical protein [Planctomycetaceae bacterium]
MYDSLFKLALGIGGAIIAYFAADSIITGLTGKHIHQHVYDCLQSWFPEFNKAIADWCQATAEWVQVNLQLIDDDFRVGGRKILRAIGVLKKQPQNPVNITETYLTPEQLGELGFDLSTQELVYVY